MSNTAAEDLSQQIGANLPYLRRYARALTGSRESGDKYAVATLEAILADPSQYDSSLSSKVALLQAFHVIWRTSGATVEVDATGSALQDKALQHLAQLTPNTREALLLHTLEELGVEDVARVMQIDMNEAQSLIDIAYREMADAVAGRVLVIEDEAVIAMDLEGIVSDMHHSVIGVARTKAGALALAAKEPFDLILSDIQLADGSSGVDAVNEIIATYGDTPVIFITAFPKKLLTGEGPEPAFLITKPYSEEQVKSAVSQAMFFASTETLRA